MSNSEVVAALPMYDWPEVRAANDELWQAIARQLRAAGVPAPARLEREVDREEIWKSDSMIVSQTCGLPFVQGVDRHATVLGTFDYGISECAAGDYNSVIVVREDDSALALDDVRDYRVAFNSHNSQSGCAALLAVVAPLATAGRFFGSTLEVGTHRDSMRAVSTGAADVAALDAVSWQLGLDYEPGAAGLRILATTPCTPGLPVITSRQLAAKRGHIIAAIVFALDEVDAEVLATLHIRGFAARTDAEYDVIARRLSDAADLGYAELA